MTVIERFFQYLEFKGLKHTPVEKDLGLSNGYLGKMMSRKGTIGDETLQKIFSFFPELNIIWLMTGNGNMEDEKLHLKIAPNSAPNSAPNLNSDEKFPSDNVNGCENCKKLENHIFTLLDTVKAHNLSIACFAQENKLLREENKQLRVELEQCRGENIGNVV